jgi:hypothetical protein
VNKANAARARLDANARLKVGERLRATYSNFKDWKLPKRLADLLQRLGVADANANGR